MASPSLPVLAGMVSTVVFAGSMLPMLVKAARSRDLSSYSIGNLVLANFGNAVHSVYVFHLPPGPIWFLHGFYVVTSALMLCWWVRYHPARRHRTTTGSAGQRPLHPPVRHRPRCASQPFNRGHHGPSRDRTAP